MINTYRETILKDDIFIGEKCDHALIVRPITAGCYHHSTLDYNDNRTDLPSSKSLPGVMKMKPVSPPLFLVIWGGVRSDGFLSKSNAMRCAKRFLDV